MFKAQSHTWRIKHSNGQIEDWVRDLVCKLITIHHLPASHALGAIIDITRAIKANIMDHDGTENDPAKAYADPCGEEPFSDRPACRFLLEGLVMGKIQLAQEFKAAPGREPYPLSSYALFDFPEAWTASGDGTTHKGINVVHQET